jgi:2-hydroxy-3-keto-5-methylthiopentenyl-1-phosphate phosphatase
LVAKSDVKATRMSSRVEILSGKHWDDSKCSYAPLTSSLNRDSFRKMMDSVTRPFPQCVDYLVENIELDPKFNDFFQWALKNEIPTVVLSSGMEPVIKGILKHAIGPDADKIDVICNQAEAREGMSIDQEGGWRIKYHDDR